MREALARSNFDAVRRSPAPAKARRPAPARERARAGQPSAVSGAGAAAGRIVVSCLALIGGLLLAIAQLAFKALERWPVSVIGGLLAASLSAAIIVNAVSMQEGPHPSPLFGGGTVAESTPARADPPPPPRRVETVAAQPAAPVARPADKASTDKTPAEKAPAANDPIARLIATGAPPTPANATASVADAGIAGVQKALAKLGYTITADGRNGPATRQAISAFEKLEGMPVTGDPANAAMRKALSVASGIALD